MAPSPSSSSTEVVLDEHDCLMRLAAHFGLHWETIWNDPGNASLKRERKDPMVLEPGDVLVIPASQEASEPCAPESRHRFRRKGIPAKAKVRFLDGDEPLASLDCEIDIDGEVIEASTDSDGMLEFFPYPDATKAIVTLKREDDDDPNGEALNLTYELKLGHLSPPTTIRGAQQRLKNLGYLDAGISGELDEATRRALEQFQQAHDKETTGELNDTIAGLLADDHGV